MKKKGFILLIMTVLMVLVAIISINSGKMNLTPAEVMSVILGKGTPKQNLIIMEFRLPRIILAVLRWNWHGNFRLHHAESVKK